MKIGILYICTGDYIIFWRNFYLSMEQYFLKGHEVHYFVFTDAQEVFGEDTNSRIHKIYQEHLWWPNSTLMRFHIFLRQQDNLRKMDYLFFFNANLEVFGVIWDEFLPMQEWLLFCQHPGFYNKSVKDFTYERRGVSEAYIPSGMGKIYVAGGLNGWKTNIFLEMCENIKQKIDLDNTKGIIALWHDESHINRYVANLGDNAYKILDPWYLFPEWWNLPFSEKIRVRNKSQYLNLNKIKWYSVNNFVSILHKYFNNLFK